ncbi:MAG TPA: MFS transporter [Bacteroidia bacterium]|nr:MFS transporter [Bacteroidia bacterium]
MNKFPLNKQLLYATGMMGWSIMVNLIGVMLVYYYLPPTGSGLHVLITQRTFLGIFTLMALITAGGRLTDTFYDPFIGKMSDGCKSKRGRRIPFMIYSIIPAVFCCIMVFYPPVSGVSRLNAGWLACFLTLFFMAATTYIIPYNSLLPELAATDKDKIRLSTFQQVGFVLGVVISSLTNNIADLFSWMMHISNRETCVQYAAISLAITGGIALLIPVLTIDEKKYCHSKPSSTPLIKALKQSLSDKNFVFFIVAVLSYSMALNIITNGLLYFLTVLCHIDASQGSKFMGFMVLLALLFFPVVNLLARRYGEKKLLVFSFFTLGIVFAGIALVGKLPIPPVVQLYIFLGIAAFPVASLGILPTALLARIASENAIATGDNREGTYFAVNYFSVKVGQTLGLAVFAMLTIYGKDPGHDFGLRLSGMFGCGLCIMAALIFTGFRDSKSR